MYNPFYWYDREVDQDYLDNLEELEKGEENELNEEIS